MYRAKPIQFASTVGVAPGTTTVQISGTNFRVLDPYQRDFYTLRDDPASGSPPPAPPMQDLHAHIRWDIIGLVGGGALAIALMTGLIASAIGQVTKR